MLVVLCYIEYKGKILVIKRNNQPYAGYYALIGGKVGIGEDSVSAACRETREESGLCSVSAEEIIVCSETVISSGDKSKLYEYDMALVRVEVGSDIVEHSCEGKLSWIDVNDFLSSSKVVPTDIDMVQRYISNLSAASYHYTVVKNNSNDYEILDIIKK